jgi:hypothetical protein
VSIKGLGTLNLCTDCHSVPRPVEEGGPARRDVKMRLGKTTVVGGPPQPADREAGPVYELSDGSRVVPTGRLFVRFAAGTPARERAGDLSRAGLEIVEVPGYAPHAAWVRPREAGAAAALSMLGKAAALPDVENVEPELLRERSKR